MILTAPDTVFTSKKVWAGKIPMDSYRIEPYLKMEHTVQYGEAEVTEKCIMNAFNIFSFLKFSDVH